MFTTLNYSPNFDLKKRKVKDIKFIVFHYTGMQSEKQAIKKLTDFESKVSSHYLIKNNGEILTLVPDLYIAWHSGISHWKKYKSLNMNSIGIEISNPGHKFKYKKFFLDDNTTAVQLFVYIVYSTSPFYFFTF